jgi:hypothetical protein
MISLPAAMAILLLGPPQPILDALHVRFPGAEIRKWSKEKEHGTVLYDVEFTQNGKKLEADIGVDGTIDNWEQEIPVAELPQAAKDAAMAAYPEATIVTVMACTRVTGGKDALEGYEVLLAPAHGKKKEITVAPDGKLLEEGEDEE